MALLTFLLLLAALVCFGLTAIGVGASRINLLALGLACWMLTLVISTWPG